MRKLLFNILLLTGAAATASAQSLEQLNIQIHGYATQSLLYTTNNNILTTPSSDGSPAWHEDVLNLSAQPDSRLRISFQARYFLLGNYGSGLTVDYATVDYKVKDQFGVRFGKVKTPSGLYNETQDISPSYLWALLPQSVYPIGSRNSQLAHFGGLVYGTLDGGSKLGKLDYRGWGGVRYVASDDAFFTPYRELGVSVPNGWSSTIYGGALHWNTPLRGLMIGASDWKIDHTSAAIVAENGAINGTGSLNSVNLPAYFARYQNARLLLAAEYVRTDLSMGFNVPGLPFIALRTDTRPWYVMASYKLTSKLTVGSYRNDVVDHAAPLGPARFTKDWTGSGRYDINQFLYAKLEEHFINGTATDYDSALNPDGLKPKTRLTVFQVGVSF